MAIPTPVNGQITDAVEAVHAAGGMDALASITGLLAAIGQALSRAGRGASGESPGGGEYSAAALSAAFARAEGELQVILASLEGVDGAPR